MTFLCTDFISEFYGRRRANCVVFVGLLLNLWVVAIIWLGGVLPGFETIDPVTGAIVRDAAGRLPVFFRNPRPDLRRRHGVDDRLHGGPVLRCLRLSLLEEGDQRPYVVGPKQRFDDGQPTRRHHRRHPHHPLLRPRPARRPRSAAGAATGALIFTGYSFKFVFAALDTIPFYIGVHYLKGYLQFDPTLDHDLDGGR